jgi:hypothetical protein
VFSAALYARVPPFLRTLAHETAGAARTRHSLRPLFEEGQTNLKSSGENCAARTFLLVIPGRAQHVPE